MERASGIEPPSKAWEAFILPMNYARIVTDLIILAFFLLFGKYDGERSVLQRGDELGDIVKDGDMRIGSERFVARRARRDACEVQAGVAGGLGVDKTVADVECILFCNLEMFECRQQACRIGLVRLDIVAADDEVDEFRNAVEVEFLLDAVMRLIGDDGDPGAVFAQPAQCCDRMREKGRAGRHVAVGFRGIGAHEGFGLFLIVRRQDLLDGLDHGQSDGDADHIIRAVAVAELLQRDMEAFEDGRLGIDEGIVKIEEIETVSVHRQHSFLICGKNPLLKTYKSHILLMKN